MIANILNTFRNSFKIPELRERILFTFGVLAICRFIAIIPIPGLDGGALSTFLKESAANADGSGNILGLVNVFTGGAMGRCALGALGIMPYITATIIIQLLSAVVPQLSKLAREEGGRVKIMQYGRFLSVILCIGQGTAMSLGWLNPGNVLSGFTGDLVLIDNKAYYVFQTVLFLTTGTMLLMWLGEQITERGIGNGVSLVITIGIIAELPVAGAQLKQMFFPTSGESNYSWPDAVMLIALLIAVVVAVIAVTQAVRKVPVQYAARNVGRKTIPGGSSYMPLRVNHAGVMPIIFAQAILMFPEQLFRMLGSVDGLSLFLDLASALQRGSLLYLVTYSAMILFFSYFWVSTQFNEIQISDDLKKNGGYIPGVRPGPATTEFLHNTMSRITLAGSVFLTVIAVIPIILSTQNNIPFQVSQFFGGTSILITVGVMLDTMRQLESHLMMRHYDGFHARGKTRSGRPRSRGPKLRGRGR